MWTYMTHCCSQQDVRQDARVETLKENQVRLSIKKYGEGSVIGCPILVKMSVDLNTATIILYHIIKTDLKQ